MPRPTFTTTLPFPSLTGTSRRARWRRATLRRVTAGLLAAGALAIALTIVRPPDPATTDVLVAARNLASGEILGEDSVALRAVPTTWLPPGAITERHGIRGRSVATTLSRGEILTRTRLVPREASEGLPPGTAPVRVVLADGRSAALLHAGQRALVQLVESSEPVAEDVLVLSVEAPSARDPGLLDGGIGAEVGVVLALDRAARQRLFAAPRPDGGPPVALVVSVARG